MSSDSRKGSSTDKMSSLSPAGAVPIHTETVTDGMKTSSDQVPKTVAFSVSPQQKSAIKQDVQEPSSSKKETKRVTVKEPTQTTPTSITGSPSPTTTITTTTTTATSSIATTSSTSAATTAKLKSGKPSHPHRLIRQHSLAAVLGLFRSSTNRDEGRGVSQSILREWGIVREEPEDSENAGGNSSRSYSIPSSSFAGPKRCRRSSIHTDLADGTYIMGSVPAVLAIKKKPVDNDPRPTTTRRCSLTLPYANLYGSWQKTIIPVTTPSSRHGSGEASAVVTSRAKMPQSEGSQMSEISNHQSNKRMTKQNSVQRSDLKVSPSTLPLLISNSNLEEGALGYRKRLDETELLARTFQKVPMKDFGSEVRATMDIEHFLQTAVLQIDVQETSLEGVTDLLLEQVLQQDEPLCTIAEAKSVLFTHDTGK